MVLNIQQQLVSRPLRIDRQTTLLLQDELCPLHLAIIGGHEEAAISLINGRADLDAGNKHNQTPLHYAVLSEFILFVLGLMQDATL